MKTCLYLSGPMTGLPEWNFPAFMAAAATLRAEGYEVRNPAEHFEGRTDLPRAEYMREDIAAVMASDQVCVLPGWERSKGARLEVAIAEELGLPVWRFDTRRPLAEESILAEAERLVHGDRGVDYGHPIEDFTRTGQMWGAILGVPVGPAQVGLCMVALKISRECNKSKRDNLVDGAGYFETVAMIRERGG